MKYPHSAILTIAATSTQDANGDWTTTTGTSYTSVCRDDPASGGSTIESDGNHVVYSSVVYFPPLATVIRGMSITVTDSEGTIRLEGTILRVDKTLKNIKAWV